jgi:opacity protein-like surface antigen
MKKLFLAVAALCAAGFTANTFAQAQNFEGFALSAATGYQNYQTKNDSWTPTSLSMETINNYGAPLWLGGEYTWSMSDKYTLGFGIETNALSTSEGSWALRGSTSAGTTKVTSMTNLYVKPGMVLDKDSLIYAKLGYTSGKWTVSDGSSDTSTGFSIGLGYRQDFSKTLFGFGEFNSFSGKTLDETGTGVTYKSTTTGTNLLVGVGYRF